MLLKHVDRDRHRRQQFKGTATRGPSVINAIEIGVFIAGVVLGPMINYAVYAWAYFPRAISPWQCRDPKHAPLSRIAYLPALGWFYRLRESATWGRYFWVRPALIEVLTPILLLCLYRAMMEGQTIPVSIRVPAAGISAGGGGVTSWELHIQFLSYSVMFALLTVASFIDIDERTIPDMITVPGTCLGLIACAMLPGWCLWEVPLSTMILSPKTLEPLHANSPFAWNAAWGQRGIEGYGLWIGSLIWCLWCLSLGNLRWINRRGIRKAFVYAWVGFMRSPNLRIIFGMAIVGSLLIGAAYLGLSEARWRQLFSSLMGIGLGGTLVWSFRIVAGGVMRQEALGFGDVTLMAMVGAHFGWQIVLLAFFLGPVLGLVLIALYWTITKDSAIPLGPFLAAATTYLMLDWARVWETVSEVFLPLDLYLIFLAGLLVLLGVLLWLVGSVKAMLLGGGDQS
jgi:leader peptidase (prepilin peptidase)/N-methyltransferase